MSTHQVSIEEKINNFQQANRENSDKLEKELRDDSARSDARMDQFRSDMNAKYEELSTKVDLQFSSENKEGLAGKFLELKKSFSLQNSSHLEMLERKLEWHERELRKNNIVIKNLPRSS